MIGRFLFLVVVLAFSGLCAAVGNEVDTDVSPVPDENDETRLEEPSEVEDVESVVDEWRRTLTYGIDSEVLDLLPQLRADRRRELADEVLAVLEITLNEEVRIEALQYLTDLKIDAATPVVVGILTDNSDDESAEVLLESLRFAEEVVPEPSEELLEGIRGLTESRDSRIAARAVGSLGSLGGGEDAVHLMDLYEQRGTQENVRQAVLLSLGNIDDLGDPERAEALLLSIAEDVASENTSRYYAIDSLSKIGSEAAKGLFEGLLSSGDAILRSYVISALARYDDVSGILVRALRDSFWRVRVSALQGIGESQALEAFAAVQYKLERDPEMRVRYEAVKTVAAFDTSETWEYLRDLYTNERTPVTVRNAIAEQLIGGNLSESIEAVATVIEQEWEREGSTLLDYAAKTLSQTENDGLRDIFAKLLTHPNFVIQIYAIRGIGLNLYHEFHGDISAFVENEGVHGALRSNAQASLEALDAAE